MLQLPNGTPLPESLSLTASDSNSANSRLQSNGFKFVNEALAQKGPLGRGLQPQYQEHIRAFPTTPCSYEMLQDFFKNENAQMYLEELQLRLGADSPLLGLAMTIENSIRQEFVQMIPELLKGLNAKVQPEESQTGPAFALTKAPSAFRVEKEDTMPLKMLATLGTYLSKLLKGEPIRESEIDLSWIEKVILASIINKKYKHKTIKKIEKINDMTNDFLLQFPLSISQGASLKRTEENYKIVFNWCFKFLKKRLADQLISEKKKPLCKKELEDYFYNYYFKKVADDKGISITKFYKPNFTNKLQNVEKTFNTHFISHIQLSPLFMHDFSYALSTFVPTHLDLIDKKLKSLFMKWEEQLTTETNTEETLRSISNYIMKSSKCKLPWSKKEIEVAHRTVAHLFR
jgi:hypothetical protein